MGYEVNYKYYERADRGYNTEEEKDLKAKIGDPFEDVPMEKLAAAIMAQFARRDIMIFDAEIVELTRKVIKFKETKGGIILKNRKYSFDQGSELHCENVVEIESSPSLRKPSSVKKAVASAPHNDVQYEYFNPPPGSDEEWTKIGLTVGTRYTVIEEVGIRQFVQDNSEEGGHWAVEATRYKIANDRGEIISAPVRNFQSSPVPLSSSNQVRLLYEGGGQQDMPSLR